MDTQESARTVQCVVVTPERAFLDVRADFVAVPMSDGELGVLPGRTPMIGRLGFGELRTVKGQKTDRYYIDGGFVQVRDDTVTLLTSRAIKAGEIKIAAAQQALEAALMPATNPQAQQAHFKDQQRARAQIRVAGHVNAG
jgi:F-type H+-transporting ATPase subunit epsilon